MAVPDYQSFMLPVLEYIGGQPDRDVPMRELKEGISRKRELNDEDLSEQLPSGTQTTYANRLSWACVYMKKAWPPSPPTR
jgi:restriction system protein